MTYSCISFYSRLNAACNHSKIAHITLTHAYTTWKVEKTCTIWLWCMKLYFVADYLSIILSKLDRVQEILHCGNQK